MLFGMVACSGEHDFIDVHKDWSGFGYTRGFDGAEASLVFVIHSDTSKSVKASLRYRTSEDRGMSDFRVISSGDVVDLKLMGSVTWQDALFELALQPGFNYVYLERGRFVENDIQIDYLEILNQVQDDVGGSSG